MHAGWSEGALQLWAESAELWSVRGQGGAAEPVHPFAAGPAALRHVLGPAIEAAREGELALRLPGSGGVPTPSTRLAHALGLGLDGTGAGLASVRVPTLAVEPGRAGEVLDAVAAAAESDEMLLLGSSVEFFAAAVRLARHLLAQQRFVPALKQEAGGELRALWQPWLSDEKTAARAAALLATMPAAARAAVDAHAHQPWPVLQGFLGAVVDAGCREIMRAEEMVGAISERDPASDPQVAWLAGLLDEPDEVPLRPSARADVVRLVRRWVSGLEDRGAGSAWRLLLRLREPADSGLPGEMQDPGENVRWALGFHLQSQDNPGILLPAEDLWALASDSVTVEGRRAERPQETLLRELARAARLYPALERALSESEPAGMELSTRQAYQFLREFRPILMEQGFGAEGPEWWDQPGARLGARLKLFSEDFDSAGGTASAATGSKVGLEALVKYGWEISLGGTTLTLAEFEQLAARKAPLIRMNGRWVEVRPEDLRAAMKFLSENPGGSMRVGEAIRMAYGADTRTAGIPIVGLEATGWVSAFFGADAKIDRVPIVDPPAGFHGKLRPYQVRGLSWLWFLERFGFGACLADDMGLGKTIQLLALLTYERESARRRAEPDGPEAPVAPTLLVVPMSVVGNWMHEARRFCPQLRVVAHHGTGRRQADAFVRQVSGADAVITTYALAHRDRETLGRVHWQRVVLDEAQNIKNPAAKQTVAVRGLNATTRVALTGTPVENRLSELWSIIDFLNPEYLGGVGTFRKRFAIPVERYRDPVKGEQLREMIRPFVLRRLKSDPTVAADLPPKVETKEYSHLTPEQAELYESLVQRMLGAVEASEGMQRRGLVLSTLIKLKQACNHPAQLLKDHDFTGASPPAAGRSGKCVRLIEMLDEVLQGGEQALVFTQFRQMASLLAPMLRHDLDREVLVLHGGTPAAQRESIVRAFQKGDGSSPILIVSLKAGGVGLNLTAATHVFHFDRWWNPAVENQATDRAHRIGQDRTVQVHKFVVRGTLEERIDEMIEQKTDLAANIIGSGERWLTEMSTDQLRDILTLRRDAVDEE